MLALSMYTFILVCSLSNLLLNEYDDDDDRAAQWASAIYLLFQPD